MNLTEPILRHARLQPDQAALIDGRRVIAYSELGDLVLRTAGHLAALGVKWGDQVGICLRDNWHHIVAFLAVARIGAVAVQIDWRSQPEERMRVANAFALKVTLIERGEDADPQSIHVDEEWDRAVANMPNLIEFAADWSTPLATLATSGTTGIPKFTLATHLHAYLHSAAYLQVVPSTKQQRALLSLPLYFSGGRVCCLAHLLRGDTLILGPAFFTAVEYVEIAKRHLVTVGFIAPSLVRDLLAIERIDRPFFQNIEALTSVGAPLFAEEKRAALRKLTPRFHEMLWRIGDWAYSRAAPRGYC